MPYIEKTIRKYIDLGYAVTGSGELNYSLTSTIKQYWDLSKQNYQAINDIIGALEGAKAEFQRRVVVPYEDKKIIENGDVYE